MMTQFRTNNNRLSFYAFCCGYINRATVGNTEIILCLENAGTHMYSVIGHTSGVGRLFWEQFESKADAERFYASECRKIGATDIWQ